MTGRRFDFLIGRALGGSDSYLNTAVEEGVEKIAVGDLSDIREDENGDLQSWGRLGNKKLHGWEFD